MKKLRFQTKLFLYVSILITLLFIVSGTVLDRLNEQSARLSWSDSGNHTFNSLSAAMTTLLSDMDTISKRLHASSTIQSAYRALPDSGPGNHFDTRPRDTSLVTLAIYTVLSGGEFNGQITILSAFGDYVYLDNAAGDRVLSPKQALALPPVNWALNTDRYLQYFPPHTDPWHNAGESMVTLARPLRDSYRVYGAIVVSQPAAQLDRVCATYLRDTDSYAAILNEHGRVIYDYAPTGAKPALADWYDSARLSPGGNASYTSGVWQVRARPLGDSGWQLAQVRGSAALQAQLVRFRLALVVSYAAVLTLVLLFSSVMMNWLTVPLRHLRGSLDAISLDETIALPEITENDEINAMGNAISAMVLRLRTQNEHLLNAQERELQAQLNAMEAQLNSHFLYNTLAVIGAVGQMEGSKTAPRLCARLASLLRYSVDYNFKRVTLADELSNARDFLSIMEMRHAGQTDFQWFGEEGANLVIVPKLILQPIVENCFRHGFENTEGVRRIQIEVQISDSRWCVRVVNNGIPPAQEAIDGIYARFAQYRQEIGRSMLDTRSPTGGFGLSNTVMRLYLFYKGDETFDIQVCDGQTIVTIGGPLHAS